MTIFNIKNNFTTAIKYNRLIHSNCEELRTKIEILRKVTTVAKLLFLLNENLSRQKAAEK